MIKLKLDAGGIDQFGSILAGHLENIRASVFSAMLEEAEIIRKESQRLVPKDTTSLENSAFIYQRREPGIDMVGIGFGGATAPYNMKSKMQAGEYAVDVHENMYITHHNGIAKFLEIPTMQFANQAAIRLAKNL